MFSLNFKIHLTKTLLFQLILLIINLIIMVPNKISKFLAIFGKIIKLKMVPPCTVAISKVVIIL